MKRLPEQSGVYVVSDANNDRPIYAGQASNLRQRLQSQFGVDTRSQWKQLADALDAKYFPTSCKCTDRLAYQWHLVVRHRPRLNLMDPRLA